jgi:hypothetical protein
LWYYRLVVPGETSKKISVRTQQVGNHCHPRSAVIFFHIMSCL